MNKILICLLTLLLTCPPSLGRLLSDNDTSPPATITSPHPEARRPVAPPSLPMGRGWRGEDDGRAGEEADGGVREARSDWSRSDASRRGPQDRPEVRRGRQAAVRVGAAADVAHQGGPVHGGLARSGQAA
jgi:hypothetical protein